jgi:hypothetical protein
MDGQSAQTRQPLGLRASSWLARDNGAGLFSTAMGLLVCFFFLFFALQLSVTMYTRTLAASAAQEGARRIAQRGGESPDANRDADQEVNQMIGRAVLQQAAAVPSGSTDYVAYRVVARPPTFVASVGGVGPWLGDVERIARVRIEKPR